MRSCTVWSGTRSASPPAMAARTASERRVAHSASSVSDQVVSGDDIDLVSALLGLVPSEASAAVAGAAPGLDIVLPTVPGADDMDLVVGEPLAEEAVVLGEDRLDFADQDAFADRAAHVQAGVLERIEAAVSLEDDDLSTVGGDDPALLIVEVRHSAGKPFGHLEPTSLKRLSDAARQS